jgi:hypothetical protein
MPQDKIDYIISIILLATGATSFKTPEVLEIADKVAVFIFHLISIVSVTMVVVINWSKFKEKVKKYLWK